MRDKNPFKTNKQQQKKTQKIQTLEIAHLNLNIGVSMLKKLIYKRPHFSSQNGNCMGKNSVEILEPKCTIPDPKQSMVGFNS